MFDGMKEGFRQGIVICCIGLGFGIFLAYILNQMLNKIAI